MRISIVSPEFRPDIGGIETYAFKFSRELASRGHEITVFTRSHREGEVNLPGVKIVPTLTMHKRSDARTLAGHDADVWHVMNAAYAWISESKPNTVVSVHGNDFLRPYIPVTRPDLTRIPLLNRWLYPQPEWYRNFWLHRTAALVRRSLPKVSHIFANSRYTEHVLLEHIPECRGKTSTGLVGVGDHFFGVRHVPADDGIPRLFTVSRLAEPRKNVDLVLTALHRLKDHHAFRYIIVGDGPDRPRLEAMASELGLSDRVHFAGQVDPEGLMAAYAQADLMVLTASVLPGSHEGFGIAYLEAAASGVPSLAARLAGAVEAVGEGESGMFVDGTNVEELTAALERFLSGKVRFEPERCRAFARRFTWANIADRILQHYPVVVE